MQRQTLKAHITLGTAMVIFGLMAPFAKDVTNAGITGLQLATIRIVGGALLFWLVAPFVERQKVERRDIPKLALAGLLGVAAAQATLVVGISITSPVNASVEVTIQPIFTMLLAALLLGEPITWKKASGVTLGCAGAIILIMLGATTGGRAADYRGDLIILTGQMCFALYLTLFIKLIRKYPILTFNRWVFSFASLFLLPFTIRDMAALDTTLLTARVVGEMAYIIIACTFLTFLLTVFSQRYLRPTVISAYNYIQPVVTVIGSLVMGVAVLSPWQVVAALLIFSGVWLVIKSRAKGKNEIIQE